MRKFLSIAIVLLAVFAAGEAAAQRMPERRWVRKGNRQYDKMNYDRAIGFYGSALAADSTSFEAAYDMGNALFRAERFEGAEQMLMRIAADTTRSDEERADVFYNLGDIQFSQQNLKGALECFKNALRLNPSDMEAKYNYAYTKKLLEDNEQNQDQNQNGGNDNNDQNNDQNQDNKDNNQNNQDQNQEGDNNDDGQNDNDRNDDRNEDRNGDSDQQQGDSRPQGAIPQEQLEAMLDAIQAQEDKTQDKVNEKKGVIIRGNKNW